MGTNKRRRLRRVGRADGLILDRASPIPHTGPTAATPQIAGPPLNRAARRLAARQGRTAS